MGIPISIVEPEHSPRRRKLSWSSLSNTTPMAGTKSLQHKTPMFDDNFKHMISSFQQNLQSPVVHKSMNFAKK